MGEYLNQLPENIEEHIREITRSSGLPQGEESVEKMARGWIEKKQVFEDFIQKFQMEEVESFAQDDERGALALTYSGSLVKIGPIIDGVRKTQYASIGLRRDVPDVADKEGSTLGGDIGLDEPIAFDVGPVKSTSPILKIAVLSGHPSIEEQESRITEATRLIGDEFIGVNKTIISE
jgi:hypothetical protein